MAEERKSLTATLETLKKAIKVLQRDPDITNTAFGEDELEEQLRLDAISRRLEQDNKRMTQAQSSSALNQSMSQ